jgi:GMP synthase (glutamine-hydrolysing)
MVKSPSIAVLVTGDPVAATQARLGGFLELIRAVAPGFSAALWQAHDARVLDVLPDLTDALAVIITGSPLSMTEPQPWMDRAAEQLAALVRQEVPTLGICFGHQLLGHALGGRVALNPRGREMGTVVYTAQLADPVLGPPGTWLVNSTHLDSVVELPPGARILGTTELEPHAAVRFGPSAWGVQFHPEIDGSVMREYIEARRPALVQERWDVARLQQDVRDAPAAAALVERFLHVARELRLRRAS